MTDQELQELYNYAKLGKAALDVIHKSYIETDEICVDVNLLDDYCRDICPWYEFCKLRQEVGQ